MKRIIAIVLALVMTFALCGFTYQRSDADDTLVYTALGDSASNGYGMAEYGSRTYIYGQVVDASYPALFAKGIGATTFNQDCLSGLRTEDLRYLLDPENYNGDEYSHGTSFGGYVMGSIAKDGIESFEQLSDLYIQHVKEADVITLDIGLNNFGNFLTTQINRYLAGEEPYKAKLNSEMLAFLESDLMHQIHDALLNALSGIEITEGMSADTVVGLVENLLSWLAYTYVDNLTCFDAVINRIYELNPDCELYVLGLYDCFPELNLTDGMINIGRLNTLTMQSINAHYSSFAPHCNEYIYVDVLNTEVFGLPKNITDPDFLDKFTEDNGKNAHPSYAGSQYMFSQLYAKYCAPFKDVCADASCRDAVAYVFNSGLMAPAKNLYFAPALGATRADVAEALYVLAGSPDTSGMKEPFADVNSSTKHYDAIMWAYNSGAMSGSTAKLFAPSAVITRASLASILWACAGSPASAKSAGFIDKYLMSTYSRTAAQWAVENGIMSTVANSFNPYGLVTRADLAIALYAFV